MERERLKKEENLFKNELTENVINFSVLFLLQVTMCGERKRKRLRLVK